MPSKEREYRSLEIRRAERAEGDEKNYIVDGYFTTFNDTYELYRDGNYIVKETMDRDAFKNTDMSDVVFQINHEGRVYARTRNGSIELDFDEHGAHHRTNLGLTSSSRSVYEDVDAGLYDRMSFAFTVTKDSYTEEEQNDGSVVLTRTILEVGKIYDISVVDFPANPNTAISARTKELCDGEIAKFEAERLHREEIRSKREAILARLRQEDKTND